jgi:hypothetical protein
MARAMMAHDPKLAADFRAKVASDTAFAKDPARARLVLPPLAVARSRAGPAPDRARAAPGAGELPGAAAGDAAVRSAGAREHVEAAALSAATRRGRGDHS